MQQFMNPSVSEQKDPKRKHTKRNNFSEFQLNDPKPKILSEYPERKVTDRKIPSLSIPSARIPIEMIPRESTPSRKIQRKESK